MLLKRTVATVIALLLFIGSFCVVSFAEEETNLCRVFDKTAGVFVGEFLGGDIDWLEQSEFEKIPVEYCFVQYVHYAMKKAGELDGYITYIDSGDIGIPPMCECRIPYDVFENKAKSLADYEGELKNFEYDEESDTMVFTSEEFSSAMGHPAFVIGYSSLGNNTYDVYIQRMQLGFPTLSELEEEFGSVSADRIFIDYMGFYHLVHEDIFYKLTLDYDGEKIYYRSVEKLTSVDGIEMITKDSSVYGAGTGIEVVASDGAFPLGTQLQAEMLLDGEGYIIAQNAMLNRAERFTVYDINAIKDNIYIQPNGAVLVTIWIPEGYDPARLAVYHVSEKGSVEHIMSKFNANDNTVTVVLDHLSLYVLAQVDVIPGDMDGDGKITVADALAVLRIAAKMAEGTDSALSVGDMDGDGKITVADALAVLRIAAKMA